MSMKGKTIMAVLACLLGASLFFGGAALAAQVVDGGTPEASKTTIFDFQKDLGLADVQVDGIRQKLVDLDRLSKMINAKLTLLNLEIQDLNEKNGDLGELKKKVTEAYSLVAELKIADFTTTREINSILKPSQLEQWRKIQKDNRKEAKK